MSNAEDLKSKLESLTPEQFEQISGGSCSLTDIQEALNNLTQSYEALVDFTSHVIERVVGP